MGSPTVDFFFVGISIKILFISKVPPVKNIQFMMQSQKLIYALIKSNPSAVKNLIDSYTRRV